MNLRIQTYGKSFINLTPDPRGLDPYPILSHPILFHPTNLFQFSRLARQGSLLTDLTQTKLQTVRRPSKRSRRASTTWWTCATWWRRSSPRRGTRTWLRRRTGWVR